MPVLLLRHVVIRCQIQLYPFLMVNGRYEGCLAINLSLGLAGLALLVENGQRCGLARSLVYMTSFQNLGFFRPILVDKAVRSVQQIAGKPPRVGCTSSD